MGCMYEALSQQKERRKKGREEGNGNENRIASMCRIQMSVKTGKSKDVYFLCSYRLCNELTAIYVNASEMGGFYVGLKQAFYACLFLNHVNIFQAQNQNIRLGMGSAVGSYLLSTWLPLPG